MRTPRIAALAAGFLLLAAPSLAPAADPHAGSRARRWKRLRHELSIIEEKGFSPYFLVAEPSA